MAALFLHLSIPSTQRKVGFYLKPRLLGYFLRSNSIFHLPGSIMDYFSLLFATQSRKAREASNDVLRTMNTFFHTYICTSTVGAEICWINGHSLISA